MRDNSDSMIREQVDALGRPTVGMLEREIARIERGQAYRKLARGIVIGLIAAAAAIIIVTNLWVAVMQVDGSSMEPMLRMDEIILATRGDRPAKNDVIVFEHNNKTYIKRVIAAGGDRVDIRKDGVVTVNGVPLKEPYVSELSIGSYDIDLPFQVPPETYFVLGDNRPASMDSRDSRIGPVGREQIIGKVIFRMWPALRLGAVK